MRLASSITEARIQIRAEYLILTDFPRQKWLRERASSLPYTYISCPFTCLVFGYGRAV